MKRNNFFKGPQTEKSITCSCGSSSKLGSRKNYPFGRGSKPIRTKFYRCKSCTKTTIITNSFSGKKN